MFNTGLLIITLGVIGIFLNSKFYNYITFAQVGIIILGIVNIIYKMEKKWRRKK